MEKISVKDVAFSGYRLLATKPMVAVAWFVFQLAVALAITALGAAMAGPQLAALQEMNAAGPAAGDQATRMALFGQTLPFTLLSVVIALFTAAITLGAASRAVLAPETGGLGYLRLGKDELRLIVTTLVIGILIVVAGIVTAFLGTIGMMSSGRDTIAAMGAGHIPQKAMIMYGLFALPGILLIVFLWVKLSLAPTQTVAERGIRIFGSWGLTRGNFWRLVGAYILAAIPLLIVSALASAAVLAMGGADINGKAMMSALHPARGVMADVFAPMALVALVLGAVVNTLSMAAFFVPAAKAYTRLAPAPDAAYDDESDED